MRTKCSYYNCENSRFKNKGLHFFAFPKNENLQKVWLKMCGNIQLVGLLPEELHTYILCEEHFNAEDFKTSSKLLPGAIPRHYKFGKNPMPAIFCCVDGCYKSRLSKHRFPNPSVQSNGTLFDKWVNLCGNRRLKEELTPEKIYANCRVCAAHFKPEDFGPNNRLLRGVWPSVNLPNSLSHEEDPSTKSPSFIRVLQNDPNNTRTENVNNSIELADTEPAKICRLCMDEITDAKNIFEDYVVDNVPIYLAIRVCLHPIKISIEDSLSQYTCSECLNTLSKFVEFRTFVLKNDKILRTHLSDSVPLVSKEAPGQKRIIETENEHLLLKKIKIENDNEQTNSFGSGYWPKSTNQVEEKRNTSKEELHNKESCTTPRSRSVAFVEALHQNTYKNEQESIQQSDSDDSLALQVVKSEIEIDINELSFATPVPIIKTYGVRKWPELTIQDEEKLNNSKEIVSPNQQVENELDIKVSPSAIPNQQVENELDIKVSPAAITNQQVENELDIKVSPSAIPISRSIVDDLLQKTNNNEHGVTMQSNLEVEVSNCSQTMCDIIPFCIANGYLMEHKLLKGNLRYLKCVLVKCPAVGTQELLSSGGFKNKVSIDKQHNHEKPTEIDIKKQKFISVIRKKLHSAATGSSIKSIYDEVCKLHPDLAQLVPMKELKKDICNL